jgi:hypothetical protein
MHDFDYDDYGIPVERRRLTAIAANIARDEGASPGVKSYPGLYNPIETPAIK